MRLLFWSSNTTADIKDLQTFVYAARMIDGVLMSSIQIVWMLFLISTSVLGLHKEGVTDSLGNTLSLWDSNWLNLASNCVVLVYYQVKLWRSNFPLSTAETGADPAVRFRTRWGII